MTMDHDNKSIIDNSHPLKGLDKASHGSSSISSNTSYNYGMVNDGEDSYESSISEYQQSDDGGSKEERQHEGNGKDSKDDDGDDTLGLINPRVNKPRSNNELSQEDKIGLYRLPDQRQFFSHRKGGQLNLMICGQVGSGKSSFINTLFDYPLLDHSHQYNKNLINYHKFNLVENNYPLKLNIVETSGLGQLINNDGSWILLKNFIEQQFKLYLFQDQQPNRVQKVDNRIHCCIYMLPNCIEKLTPLDIETLKSLCPIVNLIPIIGKCDILNPEEIDDYKVKFKNMLQLHDIHICDFLNDEELMESINQEIPYTFIAANDMIKNNHGELVRGRKFGWGSIEIENDHYCDFNLIKKILISDHTLDFILSTEQHYEHFRRNFLLDKFNISGNTLNDDDDTESLGFSQLKIYSNLTFKDFQQQPKPHDDIFSYKEHNLKNKYNNLITTQEKRFKDWKRALVIQQGQFNQDLETTHTQMLNLYETVCSLEEGFGMVNPSLKTLDLNSSDKNLEQKLSFNW